MQKEMGSSHPWKFYNTVFTNAKAGMDGVDKEKVQKVVYEMSKGSKFFENEKRKEAAVQQRIDHMRNQASKLTSVDLANFEKIADKRLADLEANRDLSRIWMHVDLDAFYAAVETLENPSLAGKPMAVGGLSMISTANYEARRFGVRSAMPGFIARRLCPDLIFIPPDFDKYSNYSKRVREVFSQYDAHFISRGMDEAYLDVTELCTQRRLSAAEVAEELRNRVHKEVGLTCSAGVGPNRLLAKVCSDINKPNGQFILQNEREAAMNFISTLPIRKVGGIGKVTETLLKEVLGIDTCKDLIEKRASIFALFSSITADFFLSVGLGVGGSDLPEEEPRKSVSCERTFSSISVEKDLLKKLEELAETLSRDLEQHNLSGRTLTLKLKTTDFQVRTRSLSPNSWISSKEEIYAQASKLLKAEFPISLRLMGLRMSHFKNEIMDPTQRMLTFDLGSGSRAGKDRDILQELCPCFDDSDAAKLVQGNASAFGTGHGCNRPDLRTINEAEGSSVHAKEMPSFHLQMSCSFSNQDSSLCSTKEQTQEPEQNSKLSCIGDVLLDHQENESPFITTGLSNLSETQLAFPEQINRGNVAVKKSDFMYPQRDFDVESTFDSRFSDTMTWVDGIYCSLCGLELPESFEYERQEHTDYHYAQMLQQEFSRKSFNTVKQQMEITQSLTTKKSLQPKGRCMKAGSSQQKKSKHVPIDAFFSSGQNMRQRTEGRCTYEKAVSSSYQHPIIMYIHKIDPILCTY